MVLHILTAVTRPENLPKLAESLIPAAAAGVELAWHVGYDLEHRHVAGQAVKNRLLDRISPSQDWVWILDDDNTARSEEHTSELQSRFGISYAVFCLKKK